LEAQRDRQGAIGLDTHVINTKFVNSRTVGKTNICETLGNQKGERRQTNTVPRASLQEIYRRITERVDLPAEREREKIERVSI
jgi:hypothetical protein